MRSAPVHTLTCLGLQLALFSTATAQTTWVVDDNGTGDHVHIQDAVDVAADGDVEFVLDGAYAGFTIDGKSLVVAGEPGAVVQVAAYSFVRNLAAGQRVELEGLRFGQSFAGSGDATLSLDDNLGSVRLVDCEVFGPVDTGLFQNLGLDCEASNDVDVLRCTIEGGYDYYPGGSEAVRADASSVRITDSTLQGGRGWNAKCCCISGGDGAVGLSGTGASTLALVGATVFGGLFGSGAPGCGFECGFGTCSDGVNGEALSLDALTGGTFAGVDFNGQATPPPTDGTLVSTAFSAFCFGTWEECPCGNNGSAGAGCNTSYDSGGVELSATGTPSVTADTVTLHATGFRATGSPGLLFFQGLDPVGGGAGAAFNDGLLCVSGGIVRLKGKLAQNGSSSFGFDNPGDALVSVRGGVPSEGGTRRYQVWYRNQAPQFCTAERYNMSNGLEVVWGL